MPLWNISATLLSFRTPEPRNTSSPVEKQEGNTGTLSSRHERKLSARFFDATTLSRDDPLDNDPAYESWGEDKFTGRKHRRIFSGDATNPPQAHQRINSIGNSAMIQRHDAHRHHHHREGSAGLDILSAAANVSKEEYTAVASGSRHPQNRNLICVWIRDHHLITTILPKAVILVCILRRDETVLCI